MRHVPFTFLVKGLFKITKWHHYLSTQCNVTIHWVSYIYLNKNVRGNISVNQHMSW